MPLITLPLALDASIILLFLMSELPIPLKAMLAVLVCIKFLVYIFMVLRSSSRSCIIVGLVALIIMNTAGAIFSVSSGAWVAAIPLVTVLALVLLWNSDAFSILRKGGD